MRIIRGTLTGDTERLAAEGLVYPQLDWKYKLKEFRQSQTGKFEATPEDLIKQCFADGVSLKDATIEMLEQPGSLGKCLLEPMQLTVELSSAVPARIVSRQRAAGLPTIPWCLIDSAKSTC